MYIIMDESSKNKDYIAEAINTVTFQKVFVRPFQGNRDKYEVCITVPYLRDPGLNTIRVAFCDSKKKALSHFNGIVRNSSNEVGYYDCNEIG